MRPFLLLLPCLFLINYLLAQENSDTSQGTIKVRKAQEATIIEELPDYGEKIFDIVEDMPDFPGGEAALMRYLASIPYPPQATDSAIQGTVFIKFVIDEGGYVTDVEIARGAHSILDSASIAHIKKMPRWNPGTQRGQAVKVRYIVPIRFQLQ